VFFLALHKYANTIFVLCFFRVFQKSLYTKCSGNAGTSDATSRIKVPLHEKNSLILLLGAKKIHVLIKGYTHLYIRSSNSVYFCLNSFSGKSFKGENRACNNSIELYEDGGCGIKSAHQGSLAPK
jgi:hypothetical protein